MMTAAIQAAGTLANTKHGHKKRGAETREYATWRAMIARCYCPTHEYYHAYGGRGISVCDRWKQFIPFYEDMGPKPIGMSIERIDNNGHYSKDNCRWATQKEQCNNRRNSRRITIDGTTLTVSQWADSVGIHRSTLSHRLASGMAPKEALLRTVGRWKD
jgi:hypothetical protein